MASLRRNVKLQLGLLLLLPFVVCALLPGVVAPHPPNELVAVPFEQPSGEYPLGTDELGRDILSRLVYASRADLKISLGSTLVAAGIGILLGLLAGYRGGFWNALALRVTDVMLAFPSILLALFLVAVVGPSDWIIILALAILFVPGFIRVARALALSLRERAFVEASVISGAGSFYIMRRHLLPNAIGPLLVGISLTAAYALLASATLSYLGLGTPLPDPSWGNMLQSSFNFLFQAWWYGVMPGVCIVLVALGYMLVSQGIEHAAARSDAVAPTRKGLAEELLGGGPVAEPGAP